MTVPRPEKGELFGRPKRDARKKAGHRSWSKDKLNDPDGRRGDIMSAEKRSALMSRIRGRDTGPEKMVARILREIGVRTRAHDASLPGRPDFVSPTYRIAVFVDGDFWHGWRFPLWRHKLSRYWQEKIETNRRRDARNFRRLRRGGWTVIRIWEHQVEADATACMQRLRKAIAMTVSR